MAQRPNLLFIFTDQQRADTLGCYGNRLVETPNLDRLASEGVLFENAYVTQPVCTPSRSSIMTGLYPHTTGCIDNNVPLPPDTPTIAEMVPGEYVCGYVGKWHLGDEIIPQHGFQEWISIEDYYRAHYSRPEYRSLFSSYHHFLADQGLEPDLQEHGARVFGRVRTAQLPEKLTKARFVGREAARLIREHRDHPFVLYVNFLEPHRPYYGPCDDLYPPEAVPVGPHFRQRPGPNAARINRMLAEHYMRGGHIDGQDLTTEAGCRKTRAKYLGNVTLVDRAVGDILQALEEEGLSHDTIVVYTSDHGDMMGDHGIFEKCCQYEEAVRVPLIVRVPWLVAGGRRIGGYISQIDLVPTLLDLLGQPLPPHLHGVSRLSLLQGQAGLHTRCADDVFIEWNGSEWRPPRAFPNGIPAAEWQAVRGPWRTIVTADGWKLSLSPIDQGELYDLHNDPYEETNLFDDPQQRRRIRQLEARIRGWQAQTADPLSLPEA